MEILPKPAVWSILVFVCGTALPTAGQCSEVENLAQSALASLVTQKYAAAVDQFHYAATVSEQARIEDRKGMVGMLRAVFTDLDGLPHAQRARDLDTADLAKGSMVLGIFAGDASDWKADSTRFFPTQVCYRVSRKGNESFVVSFRYIHPEDRWELLDILLLAPAQDVDAVAQLNELQKRVLDLMRAQAATPRT
jgi:hypothetical protein